MSTSTPTTPPTAPLTPSWGDLPPAVRRRALARKRLRRVPADTLATAGLTPDPWQADFLRASCGAPGVRSLLLCCRQAGKSTAAAALALWTALLEPRSLVLLLSPTLRQSGELFRDKALRLYAALGQPVGPRRETQLELELQNGSRLVSLPESEAGIRGFSGVRLLVIDEAARVGDDLYRAVRPMLATSGGGLVALSTPFGRRGWFFDAWHGGAGRWSRVRAAADACPRITPEFLAEERAELGPLWFRQEYECEFNELTGSLFDAEAVARAFQTDLTPLWE
jgi:hypothetical protein